MGRPAFAAKVRLSTSKELVTRAEADKATRSKRSDGGCRCSAIAHGVSRTWLPPRPCDGPEGLNLVGHGLTHGPRQPP
jgi:hypothetical protein